MGILIKGQWHDQWYDTSATGGEFKRQESRFRHWVTADGSPGPQGQRGFAAASGRYHLFVSMACPWAHRTLVFRALKGLNTHIGVTTVTPLMLENGWEFATGGDELYGLSYLYQLYLKAAPDYEGRVTVPILWDKQEETLVNNESSEIIRILNTAFDGITGNTLDFYPEDLRPEIDAINTRVYDTVNNGVYKAGFATTQTAYEKAYNELFDSLDWINGLLAEQPFLAGTRLTEADWRLFPTLVRFDSVYHGHFKCNRRRLLEYAHIPAYMKRLYQMPGVAQTLDLKQAKAHYYGSHKSLNPTGIIPAGPERIFP
ncbi:MAG: glutathione S-transferase family protein [Pseudomonadales bacterium]|nr:glutathione S-transferase family protein [Pseudomonadales bacterium]